MSEKWLSTDEAIEEVVGYCVKLSDRGTMPMSIRCPDAEIEQRVIAYLKKQRCYPRIDTYIGAIDDTVAGQFKSYGGTVPDEGDAPPKKERKKRVTPPVEMTPEEEQIVDDKHAAQMADLEPSDTSGLFDDDVEGLV